MENVSKVVKIEFKKSSLVLQSVPGIVTLIKWKTRATQACRETQMQAGKWAQALIFLKIPNLSGSNKENKKKKNYWCDIFGYEGYNSWHTRYI